MNSTEEHIKHTSLPIAIKVENMLSTDEWVNLFDYENIASVNFGNKTGCFVESISGNISYGQILGCVKMTSYSVCFLRVETDILGKHVEFESSTKVGKQTLTHPIWMFTDSNGASEKSVSFQLGISNKAEGSLRVLVPKRQSITVFFFPLESMSPPTPKIIIE